MTFMPALASSAAMMPPAAPTPTITTSVFSVAIAQPSLGLCPRLETHNGLSRERFRAVHVIFGEHRLSAGKFDQPPACEILIPAVHGVGKHAFHRVAPHNFEKFVRLGPIKARYL